MKKLILILTIIFCFNTAYSQTKQLSLEDKNLKENSQTKVKANWKDFFNDNKQETSSNWKDAINEYKLLFKREPAPIIKTVNNNDTITNVEAAGILLTRSGEIKNQAIKETWFVVGTIAVVNAVILFSMMDNQTEPGLETLFLVGTIPVGVGFGINYWVQTYKGNKYLAKAGRYLSIKGEDGYEKIDGKYYYIKYTSK